jgi:two-component system, chemotaxis family, chemotaxis protein CheY
MIKSSLMTLSSAGKIPIKDHNGSSIVSDVFSKDIRILLVDDFEIVRLMLKNALSGLGYTNIEEAEDGQIALNKLKSSVEQKSPYVLVFCDWNMPNMTGIEVLETCKKTPPLSAIPIVMVTAESEQSQVIRALRSGAADYIVKPIAPDLLEKKVNKILAKLAGKAA